MEEVFENATQEEFVPETAETPVEETVAQPPKKKGIPVWAWIAAGAVVLVIAVIVLISAMNNTYKTPLEREMDVRNSKTFSAYEKAEEKLANGLAESEQAKLAKIMKKSEDYKDNLEDSKEDFEEGIEELEEEYGKNYKYSYKIDDKDKIDSDDLKDLEKKIRDWAKDGAENIEEEIEDYDSDDWEDMGDELGISKADAKNLAKAYIDYYEYWKDVKVTAGYKLEVTYTTTGSELDEPEEDEDNIVYVVKVNGRWVDADNLPVWFEFED